MIKKICSGRNLKVELDLSICATGTDLNAATATSVNTSNLESKYNLAHLKTQVDKIDVHKLKTDPAALSKLSNIIVNDVVETLCMINKSLRSMPLIQVDLLWKLW